MNKIGIKLDGENNVQHQSTISFFLNLIEHEERVKKNGKNMKKFTFVKLSVLYSNY